jgi:hypothetical protein
VNDLQMERAAADVAQERRDALAAQAEARLAETQTALDELERRRDDAQAAPVPAAPRPIATRLLVAFLFGALAMGVTYLLLHP